LKHLCGTIKCPPREISEVNFTNVIYRPGNIMVMHMLFIWMEILNVEDRK
jgi:hypothetical protein